MFDLVELAGKIEELRKIMHNLTENSDNLLDPEVVAASQMLDIVLTEYEKTVNKHKGK